MYTVTSEIYKETNFKPIKGKDGKVTSKFEFVYPADDEVLKPTVDKDGDLIVPRKKKSDATTCGTIELQHSEATEIKLVGLQVWRGALLLADYIFHRRDEFKDKTIMELGAGVGLTSLAAALYVKKVVCTDVDIGGILDLIRNNVKLNSKLCDTSKIDVMEYDFMKPESEYSRQLLKAIDESDIVVAADVIYDDDLTNAFIKVIDAIFQREQISGRKKEIFVALEKRYVFTFSEMDAVAPMFEYFLKQTLHKPWKFKYIETDFPQYFKYERCKHLVLLQITKS
ncbi:methyltransferase-like protein 22 [Musca vetustissima]|uniref:methyltransferase-like protein 22 n=1 Tax=Musca vetustissima TaxID=27455 RepID=UPI002AB6C2CA|nr:methyltransferase-like protein 22 [Musca vetustissima]